MSEPSADVWDAADRALARGEETFLLADTLWAAGHRAAALTRATDQLQASLGEIRELLDEGDTPLRELLGSLGLSDIEAREIAQTLSAMGALPEDDAHVGGMDGRLFIAAQEGHAALRRAVRTVGRTPTETWRERIARLALRFGIFMVLVAATALAFRPSPDPEVDATGFRVDGLDAWPPENAVDADEMTYWHLPPDETGSLVIAVDPPRPVRRIRILNGHDLHADDRNRKDRRRFGFAAKTVRIMTSRDREPVAETRTELPRLRRFDRVLVTLEEDAPVDRVRIEIEDWYGNGGGLAEVEVLP